MCKDDKCFIISSVITMFIDLGLIIGTLFIAYSNYGFPNMIR